MTTNNTSATDSRRSDFLTIAIIVGMSAVLFLYIWRDYNGQQPASAASLETADALIKRSDWNRCDLDAITPFTNYVSGHPRDFLQWAMQTKTPVLNRQLVSISEMAKNCQELIKKSAQIAAVAEEQGKTLRQLAVQEK